MTSPRVRHGTDRLNLRELRFLVPPLVVALALRVLLVLSVENSTSDSEQYLAIARNLWRHGAYSASEVSPLLPTM